MSTISKPTRSNVGVFSPSLDTLRRPTWSAVAGPCGHTSFRFGTIEKIRELSPTLAKNTSSLDGGQNLTEQSGRQTCRPLAPSAALVTQETRDSRVMFVCVREREKEKGARIDVRGIAMEQQCSTDNEPAKVRKIVAKAWSSHWGMHQCRRGAQIVHHYVKARETVGCRLYPLAHTVLFTFSTIKGGGNALTIQLNRLENN